MEVNTPLSWQVDLVGESKAGSGDSHFPAQIFSNWMKQKVACKHDYCSVVKLATPDFIAVRQIATHSDVEVRVVNYVGYGIRHVRLINWQVTSLILSSGLQVVSMIW